MTTNFKIIGFDESSGVVVVRYADDRPPVSVDVPLDADGLYIVGDALNEHIKGFIPTEFLGRIEQIKQGIPNVADVFNMVQEEVAPEQDVAKTENAIMWENVVTEQSVAKMLVKWGVLEQNPTTVPVTTQ